MIKKILVSLDGSEYSTAVTEASFYLAKGFGASINGLYVVDIVALEGSFLHDLSGALGFEPLLNFSSKVKDILELKGKDILKDFTESAKGAGVECSTDSAYGVISTEICDKAKLADMIVVGRRGGNVGIAYELMGSTTEGVIRKASVPVFVVSEKFQEPKKM